MPTSQFDKPPTRHVENRHCQKPHGVNENQTMSVPGRPMRKVRDVCALPAYPLSCLPMLANVGNRRSNSKLVRSRPMMTEGMTICDSSLAVSVRCR